MADKVVSGIGRELRYFEYKFRKKQQSQKKNKKDKNGNNSHQELAWSDSSDFSPSNEEVRKAMPGNSGEEALQVQVAMAMSREEEQERARQAESDKLRLEMAIKESMKHAEGVKKVQEVRSQPSLLDLSLSAPRSAATAPASNSNMFGAPAATATNDPWSSGLSSTTAASSSGTFDPFASQQPPAAAQTGVQPVGNLYSMPNTANNFGASSSSAWGMPQQATVPVQSQNPWGVPETTQPATAYPAPQADPWGASAPAPAPAPRAVSNVQTDAWGASTPAPTPAPRSVSNAQTDAWGALNQPVSTQSQVTPTQNGAWGNPDPFSSVSQPPPQAQQAQSLTFDPFSGTMTAAPPTQSQPDMFSTTVTPVAANPVQSSNPFGSQGGAFTAPPFDPLKDFDNLHIGAPSNGYQEPEPILLSQDYSAGKSVAKDLFPASQMLQPQPVLAPSNTNGALETTPATKSNDHSAFLGENSSLVNLESGWKYQTPYCAKPLGTTAQNPFQQTGPSKTLNEMMNSGKQSGFS